ncbi:MAG: SDR family NAD(P)-dependent oxidoreductase [Polyangiales bacterium]
MGGRLAGKRAIITGAASGIGRASVLRFIDEGAAVVAVDLNAEALAKTASLVETAGGHCDVVAANAADERAMTEVIDRCVSEHGGLDVMFANAGILGDPVSLADVSVDNFRKVLEVNLIGAFIAIHGAARVMKDAGGGSIICTASVAGLRSGAGPAPYSASKAAVINLVKTSANQLAGSGIRINAICPGLIETGMTQILFDGARAVGKEGKIGQLNPQRRAGDSAEIAAAALFLATDDSSYVNGQALVVDGGLSSTHPFVPGQLF